MVDNLQDQHKTLADIRTHHAKYNQTLEQNITGDATFLGGNDALQMTQNPQKRNHQTGQPSSISSNPIIPMENSVVRLRESKKDVLEQVLTGLSPPQEQSPDTARQKIIPRSSEYNVPIADSSRTTQNGNVNMLLNMHHAFLFYLQICTKI